MRRFIIISILLLVVSTVLTLIVWFNLQKIFIENKTDSIEGQNEKMVQETSRLNEDASKEVDINDSELEFSSDIDAETIILNENQKRVAELLGLDGGNIKITPGMVICAKENFTDKRIAEFMSGASPEVFEYPTLLKCLKQ